MNEPRDLVQRLQEKPLLPKGVGELLSGYGVMSCPFARAISSVAGASRPLRSVRPTPPSGMAIRTATGTSTRIFRLGKGARAFSAERLQTSVCFRSKRTGTDHGACASLRRAGSSARHPCDEPDGERDA